MVLQHMNDEEAQLESIRSQVSKMAYTADVINREVDEQTRLLDSIGKHAQASGEWTQTTITKVKDTDKDSEQKAMFICFLIIFLVTFLVFLFLKLR